MTNNVELKHKVIAAMTHILELCHKSQSNHFEVSIDKEIISIRYLLDRVRESWPLSTSLKRDIFIGPYAARNLADWAMPLADYIMSLDNVLKSNGKGIDRLLEEMKLGSDLP